jgi:hypothetical protein
MALRNSGLVKLSGRGSGHIGMTRSCQEIAAKMSAASIEEAQSRARGCLASDYQDCD